MIPKQFEETINKIKEIEKFKTFSEPIDLEILRQTNPAEADHLEGIQREIDEKGFLEQEDTYAKVEANDLFKKEYKILIEKDTFFLGCPFKTYKDTFNKRFLQYQDVFPDSFESDFILEELNELKNFELPNYFDNDIKKNISYSIKRTKEYLIQRIEQLNKSENTSNKEAKNKSKLKWTKTKTDLLELAKAIYEAECIEVKNVSQELFFDRFFELFDEKIANHNQALTKIRNRVKDTTVLIPQLDSAMNRWIEKDLEK